MSTATVTTPADRDAQALALHARIMTERLLSAVELLDSLPQYRPRPDWTAWRAFLGAAFGLPLDPAELAVYRRATGRVNPPAHQCREAWVPVGRRGGKGRIGALAAAYLAAYRDYGPILAPGQIATLPVIAASTRQANEVMGYLDGIFGQWPLSLLVTGKTATELRLSTRVTIEVRAASYRTVRAPTVVAAVLDEVAFWRTDDSLNPDAEILRALRPAMATVPGAMLVALSSPYARRGVLWEAYDRHYGRDGDILVWQADTLTMHPGSPQVRAEVERAYQDDPLAAAAEYGAQFRDDVTALVTEAALRAVIQEGRDRLPYDPNWRYHAFMDVSGGSSDSFTLAISHWDSLRSKVVVDYVCEWPAPFDPEFVTAKAAGVLEAYQVPNVTGDKYGGEWPTSRFAAHRRAYVPSELAKSDLYLAFLPLVTGGMVELPDVPKLKAQLLGLDRRTARGGRDSIDHAPGGHDDVANAVAGAAWLADMTRWPRRKYEQPPENLQELRSRDFLKHLAKIRSGKSSSTGITFPGMG